MNDDPFPSPLREFVRLFNGGAFWESHEVLEDAWREHESAFYHGLILYASAFVHVERNNAHGIRAQMRKAVAALAELPDAYLGVQVAKVREHARAVAETVDRLESDPPERWSRRVAAPVLRLDPDLGSGDEPERAPGR